MMKLSEDMVQCYEVHYSDVEKWAASVKELEQENEKLKARVKKLEHSLAKWPTDEELRIIQGGES